MTQRRSALPSLYDAIASAINGDAILAAMLAGDKVYSLSAPNGAAPDHFVLGSPAASGLHAFRSNAEQSAIVIHGWFAGTDNAKALAAYAELYRVLHLQPIMPAPPADVLLGSDTLIRANADLVATQIGALPFVDSAGHWIGTANGATLQNQAAIQGELRIESGSADVDMSVALYSLPAGQNELVFISPRYLSGDECITLTIYKDAGGPTGYALEVDVYADPMGWGTPIPINIHAGSIMRCRANGDQIDIWIDGVQVMGLTERRYLEVPTQALGYYKPDVPANLHAFRDLSIMGIPHGNALMHGALSLTSTALDPAGELVHLVCMYRPLTFPT
jgi:hypothetical protein